MTDPINGESGGQFTRPTIRNPKFIELLKASDIIDPAFVDDLLAEFNNNALDVLSTLIQSGAGNKYRLCQLWCDSIGTAHVDLEKTLFEPHVVRKIPERVARLHYAIPVYQMGDTVTVATSAPNSKEVASAIKEIVREPVSLVFALPQDIETAIEQEYRTSGTLYEFFNKIATSGLFKSDAPITTAKIKAAAGDDAVNQLHVSLVLYGATDNVSQIHIATGSENAEIAFIVNQRMKKRIVLEKPIYEQLKAKLKTMARLNPSITQNPQHGRALFPALGKKIDVSVSTQPGARGETLILTLTGPKPLEKIYRLDELHVAQRVLNPLRTLLDQQSGILLIAGAKSANKSAIAYGILQELKKAGKKILTAEAHIRYLIPGVTQYQINAAARFDGAAAMGQCLEQNPDIIYTDNIETGDIAAVLASANLSGRLVLAGIEADNAFTALEKAQRYELGLAVGGIVSQQLASRLCDNCKQPFELPPEQMDRLFIHDGQTPVRAWQEKGCPYCRQSGFAGSIGIHDWLTINRSLRRLIIHREPIREIRNAADESYYGMRYDGIKKVLRGLTTFSEIDRIAPA